MTKNSNQWHFRLPVPAEDVVVRASINGGNLEHAKHQVSVEYERRLSIIKSVNPSRAEQLVADLSGLDELAAEYFRGIADSYKAIELIESEIIAEAKLRADVHAAEHRLAQAKIPFADGTSANLDAGELLRLEQIKAHAPAQIEDLKKAASECRKKISSLCKCGANETTIRQRIVDEAKLDGKVVDYEIWPLRDFIRQPPCDE